MKVCFIGGTGTISTAITKKLLKEGHELYLVNRGCRNGLLGEYANYDNLHSLVCDVSDESALAKTVEGMHFDSVCDFIGFVPKQLERDYRVFNGKTDQFMYISSASAYAKPVQDPFITEGTTLSNPYWEYSRNKIACEEFLLKKYREEGFPITIIRPSHTYNETSVPMGVHGDKGSYQVLKRMLEGKPVIIHGDGTSLWHMTFNEDFAKGFTGLIGNPHAIGEAFQITNDEVLTWNQIYKTIAKKLGVPFKPYYVASDYLAAISDYDFTGSLIGDKANSVIFDNTKLKKAVPGLAMNIRFEDGIGRTIDYVMSHPECQIEDPEFDKWCDKVIDGLEKLKESFK